ncbi:hypothetical protein EIN_096840 [Entamoeba invadens IP1]|uniref:Uncharacterized protein n=1 Tax=Entamoeba invadens IP1 TaxID=370355 RepID=A0A0A1U0M4_ENTIV|nr:hypothetical protein EIN_096840 [Entamoeba invadens IP1]ELP87417.1 hypothetical protein EIN_096840 [Entamoeba invadens IP1]|eukprot:XP_004254188.1 hypothetical protein EIN_096840 [Entamoeba invadens IP1]
MTQEVKETCEMKFRAYDSVTNSVRVVTVLFPTPEVFTEKLNEELFLRNTQPISKTEFDNQLKIYYDGVRSNARLQYTQNGDISLKISDKKYDLIQKGNTYTVVIPKKLYVRDSIEHENLMSAYQNVLKERERLDIFRGDQIKIFPVTLSKSFLESDEEELENDDQTEKRLLDIKNGKDDD